MVTANEIPPLGDWFQNQTINKSIKSYHIAEYSSPCWDQKNPESHQIPNPSTREKSKPWTILDTPYGKKGQHTSPPLWLRKLC